MEGHQVVYGAHQNTENCHLHLAVNRVNTQTFQVDKINKGFDKRAAPAPFALLNTRRAGHPKNAMYRMTENGPALVEGREKLVTRRTRRREKTGNLSLERRAKDLAPEIALATSWQDLHLRLAAHGHL